ncbi:MAG TPA: hypothetical protein DER23_03985 [Clostridiales bacterium]|jgi:hypothetical protein|nr:hypothetical protein [Clostridiales bacterium]
MKGWNYHHHAMLCAQWPHEEADLTQLRDGSIWKVKEKPLFSRWTSDFDCGYETEWWFCICSAVLDLSKLNAKKRYEITRGNRLYDTRPMTEEDILSAYEVYLESLQGYDSPPKPISGEKFHSWCDRVLHTKEALLLAVFEKNTSICCGYSHVIQHGRYIACSNFTTRVSREKTGVNFALMYGICTYYEEQIKRGAYICDGERNILHDTAFQHWLCRYFGFRKAYCNLHIVYRPGFGMVIKMLYPFRTFIARVRFLKKVSAVLKMEDYRRACEKRYFS